VLYLHLLLNKASPKAISRRTSYLRVRLEFLRYPHLITTFFNRCVFGPPKPFTVPSTWTWIGHPVSGLLSLTFSPSSDLVSLRLHTSSSLNALYLLVNIGFQVLFHSPPGVLFNFPSRYCFTIGHQVVFSLGQWSDLLPTEFHVLCRTLVLHVPLIISYTRLSLSLVCFSKTVLL